MKTSGILLDSDVLAEIRKATPDPRVGRADATPLPTAALEGLICASARAYNLEIVSSKAEVYRRWEAVATNPWTED